jgi:hypothetical protein
MGARCGAALSTDIKVLDSGGRGDFQLDLNHHSERETVRKAGVESSFTACCLHMGEILSLMRS